MAKSDSRTSLRAWRPARTPVQGLRAKLGNLECTVANLSTTGAMLRSRLEVAVGHEVPLLLELTPQAVQAQVRIMRCEAIDVAMPGEAVWRRRDYSLGVMFLEPSRELTSAIRSATRETAGIEHAEPRILVLGKDDQMSRLIEAVLAEAEYLPRLLTHPRYAASTAKRIGAKAVIVNLELDQEFSARGVLDSLRADPATAGIPIILCARQASLQPVHQPYIHDNRIRLLLAPFTPDELVMTLDRAIDEADRHPVISDQ